MLMLQKIDTCLAGTLSLLWNFFLLSCILSLIKARCCVVRCSVERSNGKELKEVFGLQVVRS